MPRTMVPELQALLICPSGVTSASMRRWPSMRVMGSTTTRWFMVGVSNGEVVGDELEQALGRLVPVRVLGALLERDPALAATRHEALGAGRLDLVLLDLEHLVAQRRRWFDTTPPPPPQQ